MMAAAVQITMGADSCCSALFTKRLLLEQRWYCNISYTVPEAKGL